MVEKIKDLKDEILMQAEQEMHERGQVNPESIDAVKDLAEAEKACWEAEYYRSVTEAMEDGQMGYTGAEYAETMGYAQNGRGGSGYARGGYGYEQDGYGYERGGRRGYNHGRGGQGYEQGGRGYRRGYRGQSRDSMGRYTSRRGYRRMDSYGHDDMMQEIKQMARQMLETADPQEKEQLKMQLRQMTEQM